PAIVLLAVASRKARGPHRGERRRQPRQKRETRELAGRLRCDRLCPRLRPQCAAQFRCDPRRCPCAEAGTSQARREARGKGKEEGVKACAQGGRTGKAPAAAACRETSPCARTAPA